MNRASWPVTIAICLTPMIARAQAEAPAPLDRPDNAAASGAPTNAAPAQGIPSAAPFRGLPSPSESFSSPPPSIDEVPLRIESPDGPRTVWLDHFRMPHAIDSAYRQCSTPCTLHVGLGMYRMRVDGHVRSSVFTLVEAGGQIGLRPARTISAPVLAILAGSVSFIAGTVFGIVGSEPCFNYCAQVDVQPAVVGGLSLVSFGLVAIAIGVYGIRTIARPPISFIAPIGPGVPPIDGDTGFRR